MGAYLYDGVLTLRMDRPSMDAFLSSQKNLNVYIKSPAATANAAVDAAFEPVNASLAESNLRLKRATAKDVTDIRMLIQGLADHVKESDAVNITLDQLQLDGFETPTPLYHCLLLQDVETEKSCGVAVFYFGYDIDTGRFLYLEDLFIEEAYRGKGAGKSVMLVLASIAHMSDCGSFVWQALDWNTPSLNFYAKMGAEIQKGLLTSKFAGDKLVSMARFRS